MEPTTPEPGPTDWLAATLLFVRDRSEAGWVWTRPEDVRAAFLEKDILGAVAGDGPRAYENLVLARIVARQDGAVATLPDPAGPPQPGPQFEEVVSGLAHAMRTIVLVDGEIAIGPAGVPLPEVPEELTRFTADRRNVYAWPGPDRLIASTAAFALKEPVTFHAAGDWTVLASPRGGDRVLTDLPRGARPPFVRMARRGSERTFEFHAGTGEADLRLLAWWGPWLEPVHEPQAPDQETAELLERLAHPRFGEDEMSAHPDLTEEQRLELSAAMADQDGAAFLRRAAAAFGVPDVAARLAEQPLGDEDPDLAGEEIEIASRRDLSRTAFQAVNAGDSPYEQRMTRRVQRWGTAIEVVLALFFLASAAWDFLPGPWWIWLIVALVLVGDLLHDLYLWWRDRSADSPGEAPADDGESISD